MLFLPRLTAASPENGWSFAKGSYPCFMSKPAVPVISACPLVLFLTPTE